jgi:serine/threonine protein kinase
MRYIRGGDVRAIFGDGRVIESARAGNIVAQVAAALDPAHARGLVHRDVKPANVLLDASDTTDHVYLSDFGISRYLATTKLTATGHFVGTLDYVAPEQIEGRDLDGRADQYSLACTAYEMLTGAPPFRSDEIVAMISAHLMRPPPSAAAKRPGLSEAVDQVLARAMAKSPAHRYPTCTDFADELSRALAMPPGPQTVTAARPVPSPWTIQSAVPPPRRLRKPLVGAIIGTIAAAGVVTIVIPAVAFNTLPTRHIPAGLTSPTSKFRTSEPASPPPQGKNPFASPSSYPPGVTAAVYDAATGRTYVLHPGWSSTPLASPGSRSWAPCSITTKPRGRAVWHSAVAAVVNDRGERQ